MGGFGGGRDMGAGDTSNNTRTTTKKTTTKKAPTKKTTTRKSNAQETYRTTTYATTKVSQAAKDKQKIKLQRDRDKDSSQRLTDYKVQKVPMYYPGALVLNSKIGMEYRQKAYQKGIDYFRENVVGRNDFKDTTKSYSAYRKGRVGGTITAGGNRQLGGTGGYVAPQGIELAKSATGSATATGPGEIQKNAANNLGPVTEQGGAGTYQGTAALETPITASEINIANKRKGRKKLTKANDTLDENYKLSKRSLLG